MKQTLANACVNSHMSVYTEDKLQVCFVPSRVRIIYEKLIGDKDTLSRVVEIVLAVEDRFCKGPTVTDMQYGDLFTPVMITRERSDRTAIMTVSALDNVKSMCESNGVRFAELHRAYTPYDNRVFVTPDVAQEVLQVLLDNETQEKNSRRQVTRHAYLDMKRKQAAAGGGHCEGLPNFFLATHGQFAIQITDARETLHNTLTSLCK